MKRVIAIVIIAAGSLNAQSDVKGKLATVKSVKCTFALMALGTWSGDQAKAEIKPSKLVVEFEGINADEGTAQLKSNYGQYDIIVRYAEGYLHFIQSFLNGPLYTTTILEKKTPGGKFKAMHSRHEFTDFALTGFTSSPEQYYGECEVVN